MLTHLSRWQWRGVPVASLALLLAGPLLLNTVSQMSYFGLTLQGVHLALPPRTLALIATVFALGYTLASAVAGHACRPRHAARVLTASLLLMGVAATLSRFAGQFWVLTAVAGFQGMVAGCYFAPFQILMGNVRPFRTTAWTVAFYNVSWGTGLACGPLLTSTFRGLAPGWCVALAWCILLVHLLMLWTAVHAPPPAAAVPAPGSEAVFVSTPGQRRAGWLGVWCASALVACTSSTLWPALAKAREFPDWKIAMGVTIMGGWVVIGACLWARLRRWLEQAWFLAALLVVAALGFVFLPLTSTWAGTLAALLVTGAGVSGIYFIAVYFVNTDTASHGRSVGINEAVVGAGNTVGPLLLGALAWNNPAALQPYLVLSLVMLASAVAVFALWRRGSAYTQQQKSQVSP